MYKIYPGSVPEFRIFKKQNGTESLQIRYVKSEISYTGRWMDVPIVEETIESNNTKNNQNIKK